MNELNEKYFDESTFIGGWYIPFDICDKLIEYYEFNKEFCVDGRTQSGVKKDVKDSMDLSIGFSNFDTIIGKYRKYLQDALLHYIKKYPFSNKVDLFNIQEDYNIQKYSVGGGFKSWHTEISGYQDPIRHLVFMTYLNDVEDGGTEFTHQNIKTKAEKGLTLIWPAPWTHVHRGIISEIKEKYIITGWYSFVNKKGVKND